MKVWKLERGPEELPNGGYVVFAMATEDDSTGHWTEQFYFREFNDAYRFCKELEHKMEPIQLEFDFDEGLH